MWVDVILTIIGGVTCCLVTIAIVAAFAAYDPDFIAGDDYPDLGDSPITANGRSIGDHGSDQDDRTNSIDAGHEAPFYDSTNSRRE